MALGLKAGNKITKDLKSSKSIGEIVSKVKDQFQIEVIERRAML
ncbi:MAG: hypothetical protein ACFFC7_04155 [Candidatus Hermodarchaeota archaeon]